MEKNIKVFRVHRALSWLYGLIFALLLVVTVLSIGKSESIGPFIGLLIFIGLIFSIHHFLAKGAKQKKGWANIGSAVIAVIMLPGFPLGTIIGVYLLVNNFGWKDA